MGLEMPKVQLKNAILHLGVPFLLHSSIVQCWKPHSELIM